MGSIGSQKNKIEVKSWRGEAAAILLVVVVAIWSVWPVVLRPGRVADFGKDGELIIWIVNQSIQKLHFGNTWGREGSFFDGNIFYPYKNVLAYSDMFIVSAFWGMVPVWLTGDPAAVSGAIMTLGQVLTMLIVYLWWRQMTGKKWAAMVGVIALGLSQIRWHYQVHLQMWSMQYWLVASWLVISWLEESKRKKTWKLYLGAGILGMQVWESVLPVYFAGLILGAWIIFNFKFLILNQFFNSEMLKNILLAVLVFGMVAFLPMRVYRQVSRDFNFTRSIREAANGGMSIDDLWGRFFSPGLYLLLLVAIVKISKTEFLNPKQIPNPKSQHYQKETKWLAAVLIMGLVMAMGPVVKWQGDTVKIAGKYPIPLPYAAAYYLVPGMPAFRTPSRWIWVAAWAASGLIAIAIAQTQNSKFKIQNLGIIAAMVVAVVGGTGLTDYRDVPKPEEYPSVYQWLSVQPGRVIVELPAGDENVEADRMLFSLVHGKNLLNGFSGFMPPERRRFLDKLNQEWPSESTTEELKRLGVDWVVDHRGGYTKVSKP